MPSEDGDEDVEHISNCYGVLPGIVALLFAFADGFAYTPAPLQAAACLRERLGTAPSLIQAGARLSPTQPA